jgi:hypothetical protein
VPIENELVGWLRVDPSGAIPTAPEHERVARFRARIDAAHRSELVVTRVRLLLEHATPGGSIGSGGMHDTDPRCVSPGCVR